MVEKSPRLSNGIPRRVNRHSELETEALRVTITITALAPLPATGFGYGLVDMTDNYSSDEKGEECDGDVVNGLCNHASIIPQNL